MQNMRFKWLVMILIAVMSLVFIAIPAFAAEKKIPDGVVATVNGAVITQNDFDREMQRAKSQLARTGKTMNESQLADVKKQVLQTLINRELLYQESQKKGIKVDNKEVDKQFDALRKRFPNEKAFNAVLKREKLTEADLKSQLRKGLAIQQFVETNFVQKVKIPQQEVKDFYKNNPNMFKNPEQVKASHILIKVDAKADPSKKDQAYKKIKEIQKKLKDGQDFATLAKEYSEGPSNVKGGDLGYFRRGQMVKPFESVAFSLKPGEVSDIVETRFGYHLIKLVDKKPESTVSYAEAEKNITQYLKQEKATKELKTYIEKIKQKAVIESKIEL